MQRPGHGFRTERRQEAWQPLMGRMAPHAIAAKAMTRAARALQDARFRECGQQEEYGNADASRGQAAADVAKVKVMVATAQINVSNAEYERSHCSGE